MCLNNCLESYYKLIYSNLLSFAEIFFPDLEDDFETGNKIKILLLLLLLLLIIIMMMPLLLLMQHSQIECHFKVDGRKG